MRIYLAAAYERRLEMQGIRDVLVASGHEVTSSWIDRTSEPPGGLGADALAADPRIGIPHARADLADLSTAETVISFMGGNGRGGRHTEFGYALAGGKHLIVVGPREHVFHSLADEWYPGLSQLIMAISGPFQLPPVPAGSRDARDGSGHGDGPDLRDHQDEMEHPHGYGESGNYP